MVFVAVWQQPVDGRFFQLGALKGGSVSLRNGLR